MTLGNLLRLSSVRRSEAIGGVGLRIVLGVLIAVLMAGAMAPASGTVTAKTYITLTPDSGPTGSTVQVAGFGFADGDVRIALVHLETVESGFVDELPEEHLSGSGDDAKDLTGTDDKRKGEAIDSMPSIG